MFNGKLNTNNQQMLEQMFPNLRKKGEKFKKKNKAESMKVEFEEHTAYLIMKMKEALQ